MINNLIKIIEQELKNNKRFYLRISVFQILYEVLSLKYLCDKKKLKYDWLMNLDNFSNLTLDDNLKFKNDINYQMLLHEIQYENLEKIIKEFIMINNKKNNNLSISNKRKIMYFESFYLDEFYYDLEGKTVYLIKTSYDNTKYLIFKLFDKILKLKNDYQKIEDIKLSNYDEFHYYSISRKFNSLPFNENIFDEISNYVVNDLKVIFYTNYYSISNYKEGRKTLKYLKNVIFIPENKSILIYDKKENDQISIINYCDNNFQNLVKIINNNRKVKNVLIKVNIKDIQKNNYRLGFRLYQLEFETKNKTINEIVDYNSNLLKRLERINEVVEKEINILINK